MNSGNKSCNGAPSSIPPGQIKEPREIDIPNASDGCTPEMKNKCLVLWPVSPFDFGKGMPYAPIDWPSPGDNWSWKVGKNVSAKTGHYLNRYLYPPIYLQEPGCTRQGFASKISIEKYIRTEFPGKDVDAFFASFSWKIPAKNQYCRNGKRKKEDSSKVESEPHTLNILHRRHRKKGEKDEDKDWEGEGETSHTWARKWKQKSAPVPSRLRQQTREPFKRYFPSTSKQEVTTIDLTEEMETSDSLPNDTRSDSDFENDQVSRNQNSVSSVRSSFGTRCPHVAHKESVMDVSQEAPGEIISGDNEYTVYLKSLSRGSSSHVLENEMAESRMKLSSLLALDFPLLISTENLTELKNLLSKLKKNSRLSLDQRLKLQMIEEIPLTAKHFLETKKYMEDADNFLADLENNIAKVSLNNKYNQSKEKAAQCQAEIDSSVSAIKELDYQIFQLQSRRAELAVDVELKKAEKNDLVSAQMKAIDSLSSIVQKVELGKSEKQEWELKKAYAAKRVDEILAKYESLKGFSL